jgi:hypothetical protein
MPGSDDVSNPGDYFSGHYQRFGLNVQAMVDSRLRFTYVAVAAPGKTNDNRAIRRLQQLSRWVRNLPKGYFIVGDNAYTLSNKLLIPFSGAQKHRPYKRCYNFYLSQLRIRVEMAFGRLSTKWRIFRRNLDMSTAWNSVVVMTAARLHNFVIDKDGSSRSHRVDGVYFSNWEVDPLPDGPAGNRGFLPHDRFQRYIEVPTGITRRQAILNEIVELGLERPLLNLLRNNDITVDDEEVTYH